MGLRNLSWPTMGWLPVILDIDDDNRIRVYFYFNQQLLWRLFWVFVSWSKVWLIWIFVEPCWDCLLEFSMLGYIPVFVWIKLNITQAIEKIEIYRSDKNIYKQEYQEITWKTFQCKGKNHGANPLNPLW